MATINDITQASSYTGSAQLGGELGIGVTLDPSPLQKLAVFNYYRDRDMWMQKKAEDKMAADQIATITAFDITSPLKPFADDLKKELAEIQAYVRENPDALVYSRNPSKFQELNERINRFQTKRKAATANDALYNSAKAKASQIVDPRERDLQMRTLDQNVKDFFSGGLENAYNNQLNAIPELNPDDFVLPTAPMTERSFVIDRPNDSLITTVAYKDLDSLRAAASVIAAGGGEILDENSEAFKRLSPERQQLERQRAAFTTGKRQKLVELSQSLTKGIEDFIKQNPGVDLNTIDPSVLPDGIIEDNIRSVRLINEQIDELNQMVLQGKVEDPSGRVRTAPYKKINIQDGLSQEELIVVRSLQADGNALIKKVDSDVKQHGNDLSRQRIALGWAELDLNRDKFDEAVKSAGANQRMADSARNYAISLMNKLAGMRNADGLIPMENLKKLDQGELKYLLGEGVVEDNKFTLKQKSLKGITGVLLEDDGTVKLFSNGTSNSLGTQIGPARSITTIATNKLGEEMAMAAGNESFNFNSLIPLYQGVNLGGTNTETGGAGSQRTYNVINPQTGKVVMQGVSKEQADKAAAKGYTIQ